MSLADTHAVLEGKATDGVGWRIEIVSTRGNVFGAKNDVVSQTFRANTEDDARLWVDAINKYAYPTW